MRVRELPGKKLDRLYAELQRNISSELEREGWKGKVIFEKSADLRYRGQGYELNLSFGSDLLERFHAEHHRRYGYSSPQREVEIVTVRMRGRVASPEKLTNLKIEGRAGKLHTASAHVWFSGKKSKAQVLPREVLQKGKRYRGPAVITEYSATTVVPPGLAFYPDKAGNLVIETV